MEVSPKQTHLRCVQMKIKGRVSQLDHLCSLCWFIPNCQCKYCTETRNRNRGSRYFCYFTSVFWIFLLVSVRLILWSISKKTFWTGKEEPSHQFLVCNKNYHLSTYLIIFCVLHQGRLEANFHLQFLWQVTKTSTQWQNSTKQTQNTPTRHITKLHTATSVC